MYITGTGMRWAKDKYHRLIPKLYLWIIGIKHIADGYVVFV